jgi:hypothetical protein
MGKDCICSYAKQALQETFMPYNLEIPGYMSVRDLEVVEALAAQVPKGGRIVEIGSFMGRSSWAFAKSADPSVEVYCIDYWEGFNTAERQSLIVDYQEGINYDFNDFQNFVKDCPNIIPIKSYSTEVKWPKNKKIDLIFIDASHKSPDIDNDIDFWMPHLTEFGVICGHDFNVKIFPDVCRAVINLSEKIDRPVHFFRESSIWAINPSNDYIFEQGTITSTPFILELIKETYTQS